MTDKTNSNKPELYAFAVRESDHQSYFTKIGAAFAHAKGNGFTIDLHALPVDGKIVLFPPKDGIHNEPE